MERIKNRIESQKAKALRLKELQYITDFEIYDDAEHLRILFEESKNIPAEILDNVSFLLNILEMPILYDDIEELITNNQRHKIRNDLALLAQKDSNAPLFDKDLYLSYEINKLQSSNLLGALVLVEMTHHIIRFSDEIMIFWEEIRRDFNGAPYLNLSQFWKIIFEKIRGWFGKPKYCELTSATRYKKKLNNQQKLVVVYSVTKLLEMSLIEIFERYK